MTRTCIYRVSGSTAFGVPHERLERWVAGVVVGCVLLALLVSESGGHALPDVAATVAGFVLGGNALVLLVAATAGRQLIASLRGDVDDPRHHPADHLEVVLATASLVGLATQPVMAGGFGADVVGLGVVAATPVGTALVGLGRAVLTTRDD